MKSCIRWLHFFRPLTWVGKFLGLLFGSRFILLNRWFIIVPALLLVIYSAYVYFVYPQFFYTVDVIYSDTPNVVNYYYLSVLLSLCVIMFATLGRLVVYFEKRTHQLMDERLKIMQSLDQNYKRYKELYLKVNGDKK